ncbi:MAG: hypothetical protein HQL46_12330 [Gammaproteobacteria bacterium]|nr:hypothetical protein [Gammaproteobacteria bacterium]
MKLLKIDSSKGYFLNLSGDYISIDKITKEDLLMLVNLTLSKEVEFDEFQAEYLQNQAHQIIYQSVYTKLFELYERKDEFLDQSERLFLQEYDRYKKNDIPRKNTSTKSEQH